MVIIRREEKQAETRSDIMTALTHKYVHVCLVMHANIHSCAVISFDNGLFYILRISFSWFLQSHTLILHWPFLFKTILRFLRAFQHGCILYSCNLKINLLKLEKSLNVVSRNKKGVALGGISESNLIAHLSSQSF